MKRTGIRAAQTTAHSVTDSALSRAVHAGKEPFQGQGTLVPSTTAASKWYRKDKCLQKAPWLPTRGTTGYAGCMWRIIISLFLYHSHP